MIAYKLVKTTDDPLKFFSYYATGIAMMFYEIGRVAQVPQWLIDLKRYPLLFDSEKNTIEHILLNGVSGKNARVLVCECDYEVNLQKRADTQDLSVGVVTEYGLNYPIGTEIGRAHV